MRGPDPSALVVFAFIVAISLKAARTRVGNDTINTMVTRRSTHANHAKPSTASKRLANRRSASRDGALYAGGKSNAARGGHVGNVAGFGSGGSTSGSRRGGGTDIGNVAGLGSSGGRNGSSSARRASSGGRGSGQAPTPRGGSGGGVRVPTPNGGEVLLTRRHFLYGALGIGALAAVGGGATVIAQQMQDDSEDIVVLEVPENAVASSDACVEVSAEEHMSLIGNFELPYGTLVWANDDDIAACLLPTDSAKPLTQVGLLALGSGALSTVLEEAVGLDEGFEIYDVRATSSGLIWTEADILDGIWRIYTARSDGASIGTPVLVEEGGSDWETPSIALVGNRAFWQVLPKSDGAKKAEASLLKRATVGANDTETVYSSTGRMATAIYALEDSVVITPRTDTGSIHYQLTRIDAASGSTLDTLVLPTSMKPLEAGYGDTGFTFSFDAWYTYGDGIANIGTYTPASPVTDGSYSDAPWFCFTRTPTAAPAWCGNYFIVKSTLAVCGVNLDTNEYFAFDVESGADDYGEYLATSGSHKTLVTYANIDNKPIDGEPVNCCRVRIWSPLS